MHHCKLVSRRTFLHLFLHSLFGNSINDDIMKHNDALSVASCTRAAFTLIIYFRGYCTPELYFEDFVYFRLKNQATSDKVSNGWLEIIQWAQKLHFYFSRDHGFEVKVKNCFFHVLIHKSITTWVGGNLSALIRYLRILNIRNISYLSPMCCKLWEKYINSHKIDQGAVPPLSTINTL